VQNSNGYNSVGSAPVMSRLVLFDCWYASICKNTIRNDIFV